MKRKLAILALSLAASASSAFAGDCAITTTRTACPGMETESYAKCPGGVQTCTADFAADSQDTCAAAAVASCANVRLQVTKYKTITAKYDGVDFASGLDFCDRDSGSYKVSVNFPFRNSADCK